MGVEAGREDGCAAPLGRLSSAGIGPANCAAGSEDGEDDVDGRLHYLIFSRSERNEEDCRTVLQAGGNVAVVFRRAPFPATWLGFPVIDGDQNDLRFRDPPGVVVGLTAKGTAKRDYTGFVVDGHSDRYPLVVI
jgi:hypothetical protein